MLWHNASVIGGTVPGAGLGVAVGAVVAVASLDVVLFPDEPVVFALAAHAAMLSAPHSSATV
jgi:hypothetical protein